MARFSLFFLFASLSPGRQDDESEPAAPSTRLPVSWSLFLAFAFVLAIGRPRRYFRPRRHHRRPCIASPASRVLSNSRTRPRFLFPSSSLISELTRRVTTYVTTDNSRPSWAQKLSNPSRQLVRLACRLPPRLACIASDSSVSMHLRCIKIVAFLKWNALRSPGSSAISQARIAHAGCSPFWLAALTVLVGWVRFRIHLRFRRIYAVYRWTFVCFLTSFALDAFLFQIASFSP